MLFIIMFILAFFLIKNSISPLLHYPITEIWGDLFPPIVGTVAVTLFSVLLASPLGILTGIFIDQYTAGRVRNALIFIFKVLGGIPSIVVGIFGFIIIVIANSIAGYKLRPCLFSETEIDIKTAIRNDAPDNEIERLIKLAIQVKPDGHNMRIQDTELGKLLRDGGDYKRPMSKIGG